MPRQKQGTFDVDVSSYDKDESLGKRKNLDGSSHNVFAIELNNGVWCVRYRPAWSYNSSGVSPSLMIYQSLDEKEDRVWECVRYRETHETMPVGDTSKSDWPFMGFEVPPEEGYDTMIGPYSFWSNFTAGPIDTEIKKIILVNFDHTQKNRATMDLAAVVQVQARPYVSKPECMQYFSMRLELLRIVS